MIAGIIVAGFAVGAMLAVLGMFLVARRKKANATNKAHSGAVLLSSDSGIHEAPDNKLNGMPQELTTEYTAELDALRSEDALGRKV